LGRGDVWTAKLFLYNTKAKGCTTGKGPWYMSVVKGLAMEWEHETFGKRDVVKRFLGMLGMEPSIGWFAFLCCHLYHHGAKKLTSSVYKKILSMAFLSLTLESSSR